MTKMDDYWEILLWSKIFLNKNLKSSTSYNSTVQVEQEDVPNNQSEQLNDYSFQWVWTHTLGGAIPFLFCPDTELITNTDQESKKRLNENMCIATFDNRSLQVRQIAPNLYNVSVSIREL